MSDTRNPTQDLSLVGTITANLFNLIRLDQCGNHLFIWVGKISKAGLKLTTLKQVLISKYFDCIKTKKNFCTFIWLSQQPQKHPETDFFKTIWDLLMSVFDAQWNEKPVLSFQIHLKSHEMEKSLIATEINAQWKGHYKLFKTKITQPT